MDLGRQGSEARGYHHGRMSDLKFFNKSWRGLGKERGQLKRERLMMERKIRVWMFKQWSGAGMNLL